MATKRFNEPELYLLERWTDARSLERSMKQVREKYVEVFNEVLDKVAAKHKGLNCRAVNCGEACDLEDEEDVGVINAGIGKKGWRSKSQRSQPSGLWIGAVSIEELKTDTGTPPYATVWLNPAEDVRMDLEAAARKLEGQAAAVLPTFDIRRETWHRDPQTWIEYWLPESRETLLRLLVEDESRGFVNCMVNHFESLAKFIPTIDDIFKAT